jgi:hypothetical protein
MGAFEMFLGYVSIPAMLLVLVMLSFGVGRRQLNSFVLKCVNVHLTVNGIQIKLLPLLAFVNIFAFYVELQKIHILSKNDQGNERSHPLEHVVYKEKLFLNYRNALM